ncbi:MAG: hypothetical protein QUU85_06005, partial [Candidatus Eisenbacteria bacterium]|nr:hypothetical protein [Candidatus Eisenbacteria bacterium]
MQSFIRFLRAIDLRVFQEREVGLDIYLSGLWALVPLALAVALSTVFLLSIFKAIPIRRHAIVLLLAGGAAAFAVGLGGTYLRHRQFSRADGPPPRVLVEGKGRVPSEKPGYSEGLLAIPLIIGGATLGGGLGGSLFLLAF